MSTRSWTCSSTGDYDTLGGFVYSLFGRPPEVGEEVESEGVRFQVQATDGPRLLKIRIITRDHAAPAADQEAG